MNNFLGCGPKSKNSKMFEMAKKQLSADLSIDNLS